MKNVVCFKFGLVWANCVWFGYYPRLFVCPVALAVLPQQVRDRKVRRRKDREIHFFTRKRQNFGPRPQQYLCFLMQIHRPLPRHVFAVRTVLFNLQQTHFKTYGKIYSLLKVFVYGEYISDQDQIAYIPCIAPMV